MSRIGQYIQQLPEEVADDLMSGDDLTQAVLAAKVRYDASTGELIWLKPCRHNRGGKVVGFLDKDGYRRAFVIGRFYMVHRLVWLLHHGGWPKYQIDHINGVRDDNRIENLRDVSIAINHQNRSPAKSRAAAGAMGVRVIGSGRFAASITKHGVIKHLGTFDTVEEASRAYVNARTPI